MANFTVKLVMLPNVSPIISAKELLALLPGGRVLLIDARAGATAKENFVHEHLPGAFFIDVELELADKHTDAARGGRHPLPTPEKFSLVLNRLGIDAETHVVVYDDKNGANAAARTWWMLRAAGIKKVQVLDGGMPAAIAAGISCSSGEATPPTPSHYSFAQWQWPLADINETEKAAQHQQQMVIDVRDAYRYNGESEPIDLVAGHIPGAVNIPFSENLDAQGLFLPPEQLKEKYTRALEGKTAENVIVHCGSGITACHTLLAMHYAGMEIPKLYVGSWSEWSRRDKPVGKKAG